MQLVARAGARARGADEHIVLHLLAVLFAVRVLPDPGAVALDDLAVDRRLPRHGVLVCCEVLRNVCCGRPAKLAFPRVLTRRAHFFLARGRQE